MKARPILLFSLLLLAAAVHAQSKLHYTRVATISRHTFDSLRHKQHIPRRLAPVQYDVEVYEVDYPSEWWDGTQVMASGLILLPKADAPLPMMAYGHGTRLVKHREWKMSGEETVCAFFAADGYAVALPDYIGLGRGERDHLYLHAATEGYAMRDMLLAMRQMMAELGLKESGQVFISGYSQGGHSALATQKLLQEQPVEGLKVTATAPMSGPYDLGGVQGQVINKPYGYPGYLPFLLFSLQAVHHILPDSGSYFRAPYDSLIPPYFDGKHKLKELNPVMPAVPAEALKEELWMDYQQNPENPVRRAIAENALIHWAPEAPTLLCYCKGDEQVDYRNSLVARDTMEALGSKTIHLRHAGRRFTHGPCAVYTSIYAKMWFDSFRKGSTKGKPGPAWNRFLVNVSKLAYKKPKPKR
ncbi:MAG: alpha/beta fold hydrolase [Bacteroidia bacterium]